MGTPLAERARSAVATWSWHLTERGVGHVLSWDQCDEEGLMLEVRIYTVLTHGDPEFAEMAEREGWPRIAFLARGSDVRSLFANIASHLHRVQRIADIGRGAFYKLDPNTQSGPFR